MVHQALSSLHGGSLKSKRTVPLSICAYVYCTCQYNVEEKKIASKKNPKIENKERKLVDCHNRYEQMKKKSRN